MDVSPASARGFARLLECATGQQLVAGRHWRIEAALGPLLREHNLHSLDALAARACVGGEPSLQRQIVEALLNNETFFFRDVGPFEVFTREALAILAEARQATRRLRIWSAGCSTGQEAYSIALAIARQGAIWNGWDITILGTDISRAAIAQARGGCYSQFEIQRGLPVGDMIAGFDPDGENWRAKPELRARVTFMTHNLFDPPPAGRFDIALCRNVLLYFSAERRRTVFDRLAQALEPDGLLMLGAGETVLGQTTAFTAADGLRGLYRPAERAAR